jgi:phosphoserine phosphatase RsbU/P
MKDDANAPAHGGGQPVAAGIETRPDPPMPVEETEHRTVNHVEHPYVNVDPNVVEALVETVFGGVQQRIPGVRFATAYKLAKGRTGGDIIDLFHYDNDQLSITVADIAGKGLQAAVHAAMIKYGVRAFISNGATPEKATRALDRLYLENNAHEKTESFATVFLGVVDDTRRLLHYTNAALECALLVHPNGSTSWLSPTAPLVGVFDDQHHLFKQHFTVLEEGSLVVLATDGVSEARNTKGQTLGIEPVRKAALANRGRSENEIAESILDTVERFADDYRRDDIAIAVIRFL